MPYHLPPSPGLRKTTAPAGKWCRLRLGEPGFRGGRVCAGTISRFGPIVGAFTSYHSPDGLHSDLYYLPLPQYILLHSILSDTSHATMAQSPQEPLSSRLSSTLKATAGSLTSSVKPAESELARWRRTFDRFAKEEIDGQK